MPTKKKNARPAEDEFDVSALDLDLEALDEIEDEDRNVAVSPKRLAGFNPADFQISSKAREAGTWFTFYSDDEPLMNWLMLPINNNTAYQLELKRLTAGLKRSAPWKKASRAGKKVMEDRVTAKAFVKVILRDWVGVKTADGEDLPWGSDQAQKIALDLMMNAPIVSSWAYTSALNSKAFTESAMDTKTGNS